MSANVKLLKILQERKKAREEKKKKNKKKKKSFWSALKSSPKGLLKQMNKNINDAGKAGRSISNKIFNPSQFSGKGLPRGRTKEKTIEAIKNKTKEWEDYKKSINK